MSASLFSIMTVCGSWIIKVPGEQRSQLHITRNGNRAKHVDFLSDATYIDKFMVITLLQVMKHRSIVKVCQVWHIFCLLVFRWIDLSNKIFLEIFSLFWFLIDQECFVIDFFFIKFYFFREIMLIDALRREREKRKKYISFDWT